MLDKLRAKGFEVLALHHAEAILTHDMHGATRRFAVRSASLNSARLAVTVAVSRSRSSKPSPNSLWDK